MYNMRKACMQLEGTIKLHSLLVVQSTHVQRRYHGSLVSYLGGRQPQTPLLSFFYFSLYLEQACKLVIMLHEPA